jgi:hypothetical protein
MNKAEANNSDLTLPSLGVSYSWVSVDWKTDNYLDPTKAKELHKLRIEEKDTSASLVRAAGVTLGDLVNEGLNWEQEW